MHTLAHAIRETTAAWEHEGIAEGEVQPIIGAVEETVLSRLMRVLRDWASGDLLVEESAPDRPSDTWQAVVKARLKTGGVPVRSLVSDRAQALIKLAQTGLDCLSIPDLLPLIHELVKSESLAIGSRLRQARQARRQAPAHLANLQARAPDGTETALARVALAAHEAAASRWESVHDA